MLDDLDVTIENTQLILDALRHCQILGITANSISDNQITLSLPYSQQIVGNPLNGVLHGGALTTLLDSTCGMSVAVALGKFQIAPTLDLRIDYMTAAKPNETVYARAEAFRVTRHVVFCRGIAYQADDSKPIAHCAATFMRIAKDLTVNYPEAG